jgi:hypothetical protein
MSAWFALFALPYLAVGVAPWRGWPLLRDTCGELGDGADGTILAAIMWPALLAMLALVMTFAFVVWLLDNLFRLFRHKR